MNNSSSNLTNLDHLKANIAKTQKEYFILSGENLLARINTFALLIQNPQFQLPNEKNLIRDAALDSVLMLDDNGLLDQQSWTKLARGSANIITIFNENGEKSSQLRINTKYRNAIQPVLLYMAKLRDSKDSLTRKANGTFLFDSIEIFL